MLEALTGIEFGSTSKLIIGLILVLVLIAIAAWLLKRFGTSRIAGQGGGRGRQQRLAVLDSATVDARRRLVLIRRDNVEHLILIGGPTDVVVEPNIVRAQPATSGARPAARMGGYDDEETSLIPDASFAEPEPRPAPSPAPAARAPQPQHGPAEPPRTMPRPAQKLDPQYADMAQRLEAALRKPAADPEVGRQAPAPRVHEPRVEAPRPAQSAPAPRAPLPRIPESRPPEPRVEAPRPQPQAAPQPAPPQAAPADQAAADVFSSLEDEMASLLRPGGKKDPKK
jgi:hypothetical protein